MKYKKSFDKLGYFPLKGESVSEWMWRIFRTPSVSKSSSVSLSSSVCLSLSTYTKKEKER